MIDPLDIQRLVDAELTGEQIRSLLIDAEDDPQAWRLIALGFVENQVWQQTFVAIDSGETADVVPPKFDRTEIETRSATEPSNLRRARHTFPLWGIALGVLVALGLGYQIGLQHDTARLAPQVHTSPVNSSIPIVSESVFSQPSRSTTNDSMKRFADRSPEIHRQGVSAIPEPTSESANRAMTLASYRPEYRIRMLDDRGDPVAAEIPLYTPTEAHQLGYQFPPTEIPDELQQVWSDAGFYVDQHLGFLSGQLESDGRQFIVPIRSLKLTRAQ